MEEYTREFFRLSRYATDVLQDIPRVVELYVFGLGPEFMLFDRRVVVWRVLWKRLGRLRGGTSGMVQFQILIRAAVSG